MAKHQATTLPSDKFEPAAAAPPAEVEKPPAIPGLPEELAPYLDLAMKHLMQGATYWRMDVPAALDPWMPLQYVLMDSGMDKELQKARDVIAEHNVLFRIYPGIADPERMMTVRVTGTTYARVEVLPWEK